MKYFDVVVIGSGPSGGGAAFKLAESGLSVAIIEKEKLPRYKTCGGGLVYRGRTILPFDISEVIEREFFQVDTLVGEGYHFITRREEPIISMVMRDTFDELIVKKVKEKGGVIIDDCKLTGLRNEDGKVILSTTGGEITARFVIAADGALSPTAKMAGWDKDTRYLVPALEYEIEVPEEDFERLSKTVRFDIDAIPGGYAWNFPKKNHLSIGVAAVKRGKINLKKYYLEYLETLGIKTIISEQQHGFQVPIAPRTDGFVKNNVFLVGDAAGFADPITAEGISNSIYSGLLAADAIIESNMDVELAGTIYNEKLDEKLVPELKTGLLLAKFLYSQPTIRNLFMKKYGYHYFESMADVFMGKRSYPVDIMKTIKQKAKGLLFS
ncbi:geranylgeranyl reductase family protein [Flavobacterium rakeshii]|uniref:Geranylgeranyl reductase family protein n=1 Tax=Flavobacterium rakeshii TaxID=1038845 RepID=A0A6N8HDM4_9FLAO|nr:geranylgeranyl reductase family protein [Flavobacterium rakeshii]MUV04170.1 geranylgeranyl reductase family protein [Flavobacterium rakeshii]